MGDEIDYKAAYEKELKEKKAYQKRFFCLACLVEDEIKMDITRNLLLTNIRCAGWADFAGNSIVEAMDRLIESPRCQDYLKEGGLK